MKQKKFTLSSEEREALKAVLRQRKIDGLVLRRANVLLLLDEGWHISKIAAAFYLNIETIRDGRRQFDISGLDFLPMSDDSQREGHLSFEQEHELKQHLVEYPPRSTDALFALICTTFKPHRTPLECDAQMGHT